MRFRSVALACLAAAFSLTAAADQVTLQDGQLLEGEWAVERVVVATETGEVLIPRVSIESVKFLGDSRVVVTLLDGTTVSGGVDLEFIEIQTGLVAQRLSVGDLAEITVQAAAGELATAHLETSGFVDVGALPPDEQVEIPCPLRVRIPLGVRIPVSKLAGDAVWTSSLARRVQCDGLLSLPVVGFEFRTRRNGSGRLKVQLHIRVEPPQDQLSTAAVTLELDGVEVGTASASRISTEEGRTTRRGVVLELPGEVVSAWRAGGEVALTIAVSSVDH